ncbi:hypothetical protein C5B42_05320 [Candidatus Cerribacteria bacterium 'Amazon FNV 2010 28 9']|uniref:GIY-YIG domain-containing protein n=1 Tax=Candidatus Cerribacteria bacterium 'Amazon FNV 2010 28 9' TaxID=2081795 RepID=A0A317JNM6_9BACT|nr:MAG: hypothetical protein C5B42_05320 [Candidatus Cerribacteria bacterium 'Amazon FNV 2010 28 9']
MFYTYILSCCDQKTYIGSTRDLQERFHRHSSGSVPATHNRLPVRLLAYFAFQEEITARSFEHYLKSGSGRAFLKKHNIIPI